MILLDKKDYYRVLNPLKEVKINHLFARTVVENIITGSVYVDNIINPKVYYVYHPYGNSLLFGDTNQNDFNSWFLDYALNISKLRTGFECVQAYPESWQQALSVLFGKKLIKIEDNTNKDISKIEVFSRVNFKFKKSVYLDFKKKNFLNDFNICRTDKKMFEEMKGKVLPKYFWENADRFYVQGIGFSLKYNDKIVSTAFSAFIFENQLEIGIETVEDNRGKGFALATCCAIIDYCLANNYEPIWSCRLDNTGSYNLAQKLGFEPTMYIPAYKLLSNSYV
jgi:hypothetical protein